MAWSRWKNERTNTPHDDFIVNFFDFVSANVIHSNEDVAGHEKKTNRKSIKDNEAVLRNPSLMLRFLIKSAL